MHLYFIDIKNLKSFIQHIYLKIVLNNLTINQQNKHIYQQYTQSSNQDDYF